MSYYTPQFYSDYTFNDHLYDFPASLTGGASDGESFNLLDHSLFDINKPIEEPYFVPSMNFSCPGRVGVSDMVVPEFNKELSGIWNFGGGCYRPENVIDDYGAEYNSVLPDFRQCFSTTSNGDNVMNQGNNPMSSIEESNIKVARYSVEERKDSIVRYLNKRNKRNFNKTIKYECRKTLADRRVRVRGRFARNDELCEEVLSITETNTNIQESKEPKKIDADGNQNQYDDVWEVQWIEHLMSCSNHIGMFDEINMY